MYGLSVVRWSFVCLWPWREKGTSLAGLVGMFLSSIIQGIQERIELIFIIILKLIKMQREKQELSGTYKIDRTSVVCRDSYGNTYYLGVQTIDGRQRKVCIKEYHRSFSKKDADLEWQIIKKLEKDKNFFKESLVVNGQPYLVMQHFDNSLAGWIDCGKPTSPSKFFPQVRKEIVACNRIDVKGWKFSLDPSCIVIRKENGWLNIVNFIGNSEGRKRVSVYEEPVKLRKDRQQDFSKRNVWQFGCILYELLSHGQKLIQREELIWKDLSPKQIGRYIRKRIESLHHSLYLSKQKYRFEMGQVKQCLETEMDKRNDLSQIPTTHDENERPVQSLNKEYIDDCQRYIFASCLFQDKRCNFLYGCINDTALLCDNMKSVEKVPIYIALKLAVYFYLQTYQKAKAKAQQVSTIMKSYNSKNPLEKIQYQNYKFIEEKEFTKSIEINIQNVKKGKQLFDEMLRQFPEWKEYQVLAPHKVLYQFCARYKSVLFQNKQVGKGLFRILNLTKNYDEISQFDVSKLKDKPIETELNEIIFDWNKKIEELDTSKLEEQWTILLESFYPKKQGEKKMGKTMKK